MQSGQMFVAKRALICGLVEYLPSSEQNLAKSACKYLLGCFSRVRERTRETSSSCPLFDTNNFGLQKVVFAESFCE